MVAGKIAVDSAVPLQGEAHVIESGHLADRIRTQLAHLRDLNARFDRVLTMLHGSPDKPEVPCEADEPPDNIQHALVCSSVQIERLDEQMSALESCF